MKVFIYDGSFDGLLTAVFYAYGYKDECRIERECNHEMNFMNIEVNVKTEEDKAERVIKSIRHKLNNDVFNNVYAAYLSDFRDADTLILKYLNLCYRHGPSINLAKNNDIIIKIDKYVKKVYREAHNFEGFIRFKQVAPMSFYSSIEPDHNILPLLIDFFAKRFSDQNFIIHDLKRDKAIAYNMDTAIITNLDREYSKRFEHSDCDGEFESLWKTFYKATDIKERENLRLQRQLMPKRYWKHITEVKN